MCPLKSRNEGKLQTCVCVSIIILSSFAIKLMTMARRRHSAPFHCRLHFLRRGGRFGSRSSFRVSRRQRACLVETYGPVFPGACERSRLQITLLGRLALARVKRTGRADRLHAQLLLGIAAGEDGAK